MNVHRAQELTLGEMPYRG